MPGLTDADIGRLIKKYQINVEWDAYGVTLHNFPKGLSRVSECGTNFDETFQRFIDYMEAVMKRPEPKIESTPLRLRRKPLPSVTGNEEDPV